MNDVTPPVIDWPPNIAQATGPVAVTYPPANASDNCGVGPAQCYPPSGSVFPLGTTMVNCSAQDGAGNPSACSFDIQIDPPPGAPAAGPLGLLGLAAGLAALGAWSARRIRRG